MTRRVIVLGAGASCSYSDSPTGQRPPLANQIIPTFFKLNISKDRHVLIGNIINYVKETRGIPFDEFPSWTDDIESLFTEIDEEIARLVPLLKSGVTDEKIFYKINLLSGTYNQLIFLFSTVLNEIQNGPINIQYALLADELKNEDTCITFNWDTLFDRALASTGRWSPMNGYAISPEAIFDDGWQSVEKFTAVNNGPQYLKLHGSTNWLAPYTYLNMQTGERNALSGYAVNKLFIYLKATSPYQTYENRYKGPYEPYGYYYYPPNLPCDRDDIIPGHVGLRAVCAPDLPEHAKMTFGENDVYSMPLLVPPVKNKQYLKYGNIFKILWAKAAEALAECEEIFIIGYSFPRTDQVAKDLFREALQKNKNIKNITIWNPLPLDLEKLFIDEFGINKSKIKIRTERFEPVKTAPEKVLES